MPSPFDNPKPDADCTEVKDSKTVTTIHRIYKGVDDNEDIVIRDPANRRSFINRSAYAKLHRSFSSGSKRHSVDNLKGRFENLERQNSIEQSQTDGKPPIPKKKERESTEVPKEESKVEETSEVPKEKSGETKESEGKEPQTPEEKEKPEEFTPASFGYPKTAKLVPPLIKPKPPVRKRVPKDVNSNVVNRNSTVSEAEVNIILQPSASQESVDRIAKELSAFEMDGKSKDKKRVGSFRRLFLGGLFTKDKKKKEEEKKQKPSESNIYKDNKDNMKNESNFNRQSPLRQTVPSQHDLYGVRPNVIVYQEEHERRIRELEQEYAQLHVNRFNSIRQNFDDDRSDNYVLMDISRTNPVNDISNSVNKFIDTSSSASAESEKPNETVSTTAVITDPPRPNGAIPQDTIPRAQETYQNITVVNPKATIPINSERPLPNPYQHERESPRTIERNLSRSNSKDYPDKPNFEEPYGTVFDSLELRRNGDVKPMNSRPPVPVRHSSTLSQAPISPPVRTSTPSTRTPTSPVPRTPTSPSRLSLESTKLRLPTNREVYEPQPRVRSPIPTSRVSTDKIIATELLKSTRSPTPPKRVLPDETTASKPPISPKSPKKEPQVDRIVTNALVHAPQRPETPESSTYSNVPPSVRSTTPVNLRMSVSQKMSPTRKEDVRKSVEEYYWKQLKKLKEEEDLRLRQLQDVYYEDQARLKRSRSLSPSHRGKRSLSLPRERVNYVEYGRVPPQQSIPEDRPMMIAADGPRRHYVYDQNFVRNNAERRSADSLQRPIFRRGSLTKQEIYDSSPYNKRVSFSSSQQAWPTRNGYTQSPPQRRIDRVDAEVDDEVFYPNSVDVIYGNKYTVQNEPPYSNRVLEQFRAQQYDNMRLYGQAPQMGSRRLSMDSLPRQQDVYGSRTQIVRRPVSNVPQMDEYRGVPRYPSNTQLSLQRNPVYSSRQSMTDSNYGQRQVNVRNKVCDIYGQIHDAPQSGIMMGQLQNPQPVPPRRQPDNFVRGSRLTASANDIGKRQDRYFYEPKYNERLSNNYENRPLPPPPKQRNVPISDTESGSDASEIQRIMKNKTKKRGIFGK